MFFNFLISFISFLFIFCSSAYPIHPPIPMEQEYPVHLHMMWFSGFGDAYNHLAQNQIGETPRAHIGGSRQESEKFFQAVTDFMTQHPTSKLTFVVDAWTHKTNATELDQLVTQFPKFCVVDVKEVVDSLKKEHTNHREILDVIEENSRGGAGVIASDLLRLVMPQIGERYVYCDIDDFICGVSGKKSQKEQFQNTLFCSTFKKNSHLTCGFFVLGTQKNKPCGKNCTKSTWCCLSFNQETPSSNSLLVIETKTKGSSLGFFKKEKKLGLGGFKEAVLSNASQELDFLKMPIELFKTHYGKKALTTTQFYEKFSGPSARYLFQDKVVQSTGPGLLTRVSQSLQNKPGIVLYALPYTPPLCQKSWLPVREDEEEFVDAYAAQMFP